jgi:hypothetical protein
MLLPTLTTLSCCELRKEPAGLRDLSLLAMRLRIGALVVTAEEQDRPLPVEVHEDAEENFLRLARHFAHLAAEHAGDLLGVMAHTELVETLP